MSRGRQRATYSASEELEIARRYWLGRMFRSKALCAGYDLTQQGLLNIARRHQDAAMRAIGALEENVA